MTKKEQVKDLMLKHFGPASAKMVDSMTEEEAMTKCRAKIVGFFGDAGAKEFDNIK